MGKQEAFIGRKIRKETKKQVHHNWEDFWRSVFALGFRERAKLAWRIIRRR